MSNIKVTISGFKTLEEAQEWVSSYSGGVEQDMCVWSEARGHEKGIKYGFPFNLKSEKIIDYKNIEVELEHPDNYK